MNEDRRNFVLFAVIAALILFGFPLVQQRFFPTANPPVTRMEDGKTKVLPKPEAGAVTTTPAAIRDRGAVLRDAPRVRIQTPALAGSINLKGGRIDDLVLTTYKETIAKNSPPIRLLSPSGAPDAYFASFGWSGDGVTAPNADTMFAADAPVLTPSRPVTLSWVSPQGLRYVLRIAVDDKFLFTVTQSVGNGGSAPVSIRPYALLSRAGVSKDTDTWTNHVGPIGAFGRGANYDISYDNLSGTQAGFFSRIFGSSAKTGENYFDTRGGWLGFGDKYWLTALVPQQDAQVHSGFRAASSNVFQADFALPAQTVRPGQALTTVTRVFAGAKEVNTLDRYEDAGIPHLSRAIDWGWFEIVEKPIFTCLDWLFRMVGNFGVAIILLTVVIRGLMYPIAQRQFASMAKTRAVQPKMKALQERYKDDKVKMQQEVMALYKAEKVNPFAGCLPTLLQIPIFYALYKVLMLTIEMRHQPFFGWIRDLSAPDPLTPLNLFGLLDFTPPHMIAIGIVPIVLGISMYFQFKLNPQAMDETQRQVFAILPWVLMFVMAPFAVGLQVYWITSNCLAILQQRLLYARHPELKQAPAKPVAIK
ncbi:MAG TPA: membrane protein insertase YidC [Sphingomonas sp.]|nr:membrane protein insertase YidC [Sphingomonas sp.]